MIIVIPSDQSIIIDTELAHGDGVAEMFTTDIHAISYNEVTGLGHIEYVRDPYDTNPKPNEPIDSTSFDWDNIKLTHHTIRQASYEKALETEREDQLQYDIRWQKEQDEKYAAGYLVPHGPGPEGDINE